MKPILFNTEMVKAILDGRKTVTRRVIKTKHKDACGFYVTTRKSDGAFMGVYEYDENEGTWDNPLKPPYEVNDILYVRETWCSAYDGEEYFYLADKVTVREKYWLLDYDNVKWRPSIHMPAKAARILLKVTGVRAERLRDITIEEIRKEGLSSMAVHAGDKEIAYMEWQLLWDSTINKGDLDKYGWNANPYVWVIEFEVIDKAAAMAAGMVVLKEEGK